MESWAETLNVVGLSFDILGVIALFFYEPPKAEIGALLLASAPSAEERARTRRTKRIVSTIGLVLLIVGFALQIAGNLVG